MDRQVLNGILECFCGATETDRLDTAKQIWSMKRLLLSQEPRCKCKEELSEWEHTSRYTNVLYALGSKLQN